MKTIWSRLLVFFSLFLSFSCAEEELEKIDVKSVTVNVATVTLRIGEMVTIKATVLPEDATDKTLSWTSSDPSVAKVEEGEITALKLGTAEITAKAGDKTASCRVTVEPTPVASVTLDKANVTLKVGGKTTLQATVGPEDATDKTLSWTSSDPSVAKVEDCHLYTYPSPRD